MDINVHRAEKVTFKFHNLDSEDFAFAVLKITDKEGSTVALFVRAESKDFLRELLEVTSTILSVLVYGAAPPTDEEE